MGYLGAADVLQTVQSLEQRVPIMQNYVVFCDFLGWDPPS